MKLSYLLFLTFMLSAFACTSEEKIELFNGKNLDNWTIVLPDSIDKSSVFWVDEEKIEVAGIPNGYIRTNEDYSTYKLHAEWRWLDKPINSGILLHATGEDIIWPNCIEAQLMADNAGDFVLIGKGAGFIHKDSTYLVTSEESRFIIVPKYEESSESSPGEWNNYDIMVTADSIVLFVNDVLQNKCTAPTKTQGKICLQSEGGPLEFRNIYLIPLE